MNAPALPATDAGHLDGPLLEALAAGAAREEEQALARRHLDACARCRGDLEALRAENAAFGDFFAAEEARLAGRSPVRRRERAYRFTAFAAAGLAAMLALALIWEKFAPGGSATTTPQRQVAEEGKTTHKDPDPEPQPVTPPAVPPTPAPKAPIAGQETVYRGRTAAEWILDVESKDNNKSYDAIHALTALGADAVPTVMAYAGKCPEIYWGHVTQILGSMKDPKAFPLIKKGLSDESWSMRIICAKSLRYAALKDATVAEALRLLKNDPDKAVVEVVNEILEEVQEAEALKVRNLNDRLKTAVERARLALEQKRWTEAIVLCKDGLASSPNDPALMELLAHAEAALKQETETKRKKQVGETDLPGTGGTAR
ncbi:MAG: HEAT repeat domain-containing protein [Planctomycetota bacterium]|nr:HEAT repeat domain-containing protein [Planctomycetota bacterium]